MQDHQTNLPTSHFEPISRPEASNFPVEWYSLSEAEHFWFQWRLTALRNFVSTLPISTDSPYHGLEVGCGTGLLRKQIETFTRWKIDGTDLNQYALERNLGGRGRTLLYNILEELPAFIGKYDVLILFDVIEHIQKTGPFLESVLRHLKPGGWLLINVPSVQALYSKYDSEVGHFRRYSKATLQKAFEGLSVPCTSPTMRYWGFSLIPLAIARKVVLQLMSPNASVVKMGFKPPTKWSNTFLRSFMRVETSLLKSPPLGTSLFGAVQRLS